MKNEKSIIHGAFHDTPNYAALIATQSKETTGILASIACDENAPKGKEETKPKQKQIKLHRK